MEKLTDYATTRGLAIPSGSSAEEAWQFLRTHDERHEPVPEFRERPKSPARERKRRRAESAGDASGDDTDSENEPPAVRVRFTQ